MNGIGMRQRMRSVVSALAVSVSVALVGVCVCAVGCAVGAGAAVLDLELQGAAPSDDYSLATAVANTAVFNLTLASLQPGDTLLVRIRTRTSCALSSPCVAFCIAFIASDQAYPLQLYCACTCHLWSLCDVIAFIIVSGDQI